MDSSTILAELIKERKPQIVFLALLGAVFSLASAFPRYLRPARRPWAFLFEIANAKNPFVRK